MLCSFDCQDPEGYIDANSSEYASIVYTCLKIRSVSGFKYRANHCFFFVKSNEGLSRLFHVPIPRFSLNKDPSIFTLITHLIIFKYVSKQTYVQYRAATICSNGKEPFKKVALTH